jgi:hypothetical protein
MGHLPRRFESPYGWLALAICAVLLLSAACFVWMIWKGGDPVADMLARRKSVR